MSTRKFSEVGVAERKFGGSATAPYVRPADWPTLPTLTESDQRFVGVHAVYENDGNYCALSAAGDYTVDWGDGVTENFAANVVAYHTYSFADVDLPAATSRGYKCAVVSLTMQAGQNMTVLNLHQKHTSTGLSAYSSGFLDIAIAGQYLTDLRIGVQTPGVVTQTIRFADLERVNFVRSDLRQCEYLFYTCYSLQAVIGLATSTTSAANLAVTFQDTGDTVTSVGHGFRNGDSVVFSSVVTTTGVAAWTRYFAVGCTADTFQVASAYGAMALALTTDGSGVAIRGTNIGYMFSGCLALQSVPLFNTAAVTDMIGMFSACYALQSVPLFNTAAVTNMSSMFSTCFTLQAVPLFNTAAVTNMSSMFNACYLLQSVPLFNTAAFTNMSSMFSTCFTLQAVP
jgi:surface protein